jgi:hypothetical protein
MIEVSAAGRAGTPDEVATIGATAASWFGQLAPQ